MEIKILGFKARVEVIVISAIIGCLLCCHLVCGCATVEGMQVAGSAIGYNMAKGVHQDKYEKKADKLQLSGVAELSDHYKYNYDSLDHFYLTAFFLDIEGKVLEGKLVLNTITSVPDDKFSFKKILEIPPGTVSIAFHDVLQVREALRN